jgi:hypothetical protein
MTARELVLDLARGSREAGTAAAESARGEIAGFLAALGWQVELQRFRFSTGALLGFPVAGAGLGWLALLELPLLLVPRLPPWLALVVLLTGAGALALVVAGVSLGWARLGEAREDANLIATRGDVPVRRWIVAHADTKAQGHSMAGRLVAVWAVVVAALGLLALALARLGGPVAAPWAAAVAAAATAAGFLAGRGRLRGASCGAADNASGLLAALTAAETAGAGVGIVITGAEEFGLVGARILAQERATALAGSEIVNCDTLDDDGALFVVTHDRRGADLAAGVARALAPLGLEIRSRRLPLGILVDSLPLARAGAAAVTLGRLTWRTLGRIHTPRDTADLLTWDTAERVGRTVARVD